MLWKRCFAAATTKYRRCNATEAICGRTLQLLTFHRKLASRSNHITNSSSGGITSCALCQCDGGIRCRSARSWCQCGTAITKPLCCQFVFEGATPGAARVFASFFHSQTLLQFENLLLSCLSLTTFGKKCSLLNTKLRLKTHGISGG